MEKDVRERFVETCRNFKGMLNIDAEDINRYLAAPEQTIADAMSMLKHSLRETGVATFYCPEFPVKHPDYATVYKILACALYSTIWRDEVHGFRSMSIMGVFHILAKNGYVIDTVCKSGSWITMDVTASCPSSMTPQDYWIRNFYKVIKDVCTVHYYKSGGTTI